MTSSERDMLEEQFVEIQSRGEEYFRKAVALFPSTDGAWNKGVDHFWARVPEDLRRVAESIASSVIAACAQLGERAAKSTLAGPEDMTTVKVAAKRLRAALLLRRYRFSPADVAHDEGTVIGFLPATQSEHEPLHPSEGLRFFSEELTALHSVFELASAGATSDLTSGPTTAGASKYRAGTAFIMMWMDQKNAELVDTLDAVREVFGSFGVKAVRADDIEHEGKITDRVLAEIATSEFLFADLTGQRPNVYYEVGYAHALGKRVILFRKSGTGLHFDLAGYNCPEYENFRDLKQKLRARLVHITNRNPV